MLYGRDKTHYTLNVIWKGQNTLYIKCYMEGTNTNKKTDNVAPK